MCKLLNCYTKNTISEAKRAELSAFIASQKDILKGEDDGISLMTIPYTGEPEVKRSISQHLYNRFISKGSKAIKDLTTQAVILHTRTKTTGVKHIKNTHLFNKKNWYFAHNGWVSTLSTYAKTINYNTERDYYQDYGIDRGAYTYAGGVLTRGEGDIDDKPVTGFNTELRISKNKYKKACRLSSILSELLDQCLECVREVKQEGCDKHKNAYKKWWEAEYTIGQYLKQFNLSEAVTFPPASEPANTIASLPIPLPLKEPAKYSEIDKTDSELFLDSLDLSILSKEYIKLKMDSLSFTGVATLTNPITKQVFVLASRAIDIFTDCDSYMVLASFQPEVPDSLTAKKSFAGLSFNVPEKRLFTLDEGVYQLDLNKMAFI